MLKKVLLCFILGAITINLGCGRQVTNEKSNVVDMQESDNTEVEEGMFYE